MSDKFLDCTYCRNFSLPLLSIIFNLNAAYLPSKYYILFTVWLAPTIPVLLSSLNYNSLCRFLALKRIISWNIWFVSSIFLHNKVKSKLFFAYLFWISSRYFGREQLLKHIKTFSVRLGINGIYLKFLLTIFFVFLLLLWLLVKADF